MPTPAPGPAKPGLLVRVRRQLGVLYRTSMVRLRTRGRAAVSRSGRLTGAAVASYLVADILLPDTIPVLAALTALLVVEATLFDIVILGVQRVVSVLAGVLLAVGFSYVVDISWWSLGILIAASITIGQLLRLGAHMLEVPISAMLVLAVGGAQSAASDRITETMIGAVVGVAVNLLFPPAIRADTAAAAVEKFGTEIAALLRTAAGELITGISTDCASRWLEDARRVSRHVARIDRAIEQAEQSRRLNPRALLEHDTGAALRGGLDSLEHSSVAVRSMFRSILDGVLEHPAEHGDEAAAARLAFAQLLGDLAAAVEAFGALVRSEVAESAQAAEPLARAALETLREAQARVSDLRLVDAHADEVTWELNDAILEAVQRVLAELDVEAQARRRSTRQRPQSETWLMVREAQQRIRTTTRQLTYHPMRTPPAGKPKPPLI